MSEIPKKFTVEPPKSGFKSGLEYKPPVDSKAQTPSGAKGMKTLAQAQRIFDQ